MELRSLLAPAAGLCLACALHGAWACGEGTYNMGQGLRYQGYLAPRPAVVLVLDADADATDRQRLYAGLARAGHRVTVVHSQVEAAQRLREKRYDVVIADLAQADGVVAATAATRAASKLLPVVARSERDAPAVHARFAQIVVDGASLGQYLRGIDRLVKAGTR